MKRITDKIDQINTFVHELSDIVPENFEEYKSSIEKKAACERYVEKIVEAAVDLAFLTIKYEKLNIPQDDSDAFSILCENKIIDDKLTSRLKNAKGMKNNISHQYGNIDDRIVFSAITMDLGKVILDFIEKIKKILRI